MDHSNQARKTKSGRNIELVDCTIKLKKVEMSDKYLKLIRELIWGRGVHESDSYAPHSWSTWNGPIEVSKRY